MLQVRSLGSAWQSAALMLLSIAIAPAASGCGGDKGGDRPAPSSSVTACAAGEIEVEGEGCACPGGTAAVEGGGCRPAGLPCPAGALPGESGCAVPGVPPESCAVGFTADANGGCVAILPETTCPKGMMAIPGEDTCREVAPCGDGAFGDIPVEPGNTEFVDAAYTGNESDGSLGKPWTKIQDAIIAAPPGGIVAVGAGVYDESLVIQGKPVRIYGKCPAEVEVSKIASDASENGPVILISGSKTKGTEVRGLRITTPTDHGIEVRSSGDVVLERMWVIDTSFAGMIIHKNYGPVTVRSSLIESARSAGVTVLDSAVSIEGSVVRGTELDPIQQVAGTGISATNDASVTIRSSVVEESIQNAILVVGASATIEGSVMRDTFSDKEGLFGVGLWAQHDVELNKPTSVTLRSSVVERSRMLGVMVLGAQASIEATSIRDTMPNDDESFGYGLYIGATGDINGLSSVRSSATVKASLIERSHVLGAFVYGSTALIESTVVRDTSPTLAWLSGRGVAIQNEEGASERTSAMIRSSLIERSEEMGVSVIGADATIESSLIRDTVANAKGEFGDGVVVINLPSSEATAHITGLRVEGSARAGLSNFGATVALGSSALTCSAFDIEGGTFADRAFEFENLGGNACGCPAPTESCEALSAGLSAPKPVDIPDPLK
jgi:hypothetical protein